MGLFRKKYWNYHGFNTKTKSFYDENGYDIRGYDENGYDKKGFDIHGFDIKGIHKKTKTKFDENGYDKKRFDAEGYGKDGFDKAGIDNKGYDRNGILKPKDNTSIKSLIEDSEQNRNQSDGDIQNLSKRMSFDLIKNWQRKNPPRKIPRSESGSTYFGMWSVARQIGLIQSDIHPNSELGELTERGYEIYLSLLHVIGKNTVCGAPKKKSQLIVSCGELKNKGWLDYDEIEREYFLSSLGEVMLQVLALALSNNSTPRI